jgi:hypothetical protein
MFTRVGLVALGVCTALMLCSAAVARGQRVGKRCMPVSIENRLGTVTYTVENEAGAVGCELARSVVRDAAAGPPGADEAGAAGWRCAVGQDPRSWAISCARAGAIVRAFGPVREHDPWAVAEARMRIGLLAPASTVGLVLRQVRLRSCGGLRKWLRADYTRADGATLTVAEGRPYTCANLGVSPRLAVWRIHGSAASLLEFCAPSGCARLSGEYALDWRERGVQVTLVTHGLRQRELLTIARSMAAVPA